MVYIITIHPIRMIRLNIFFNVANFFKLTISTFKSRLREREREFDDNNFNFNNYNFINQN